MMILHTCMLTKLHGVKKIKCQGQIVIELLCENNAKFKHEFLH